MFDQSGNTCAIDEEMDESVLEEKSSFKMLVLTFSSKLDWGYNISIAKMASKKFGALIRSVKFLSPDVALYLYKSTYAHAWHTVVTSGLLPLVATWKCYISYKSGYAGLLALHLLHLLNLWLVIKM